MLRMEKTDINICFNDSVLIMYSMQNNYVLNFMNHLMFINLFWIKYSIF